MPVQGRLTLILKGEVSVRLTFLYLLVRIKVSVPSPVHVDCKSLTDLRHRDLSTLERVLYVTFLLPFIYRHKMGIVKAIKFSVRSKIFLFSKLVQDYGNRSADICVVTQAVGPAGYFSLYVFTKISMVRASNQSIGNRHDNEVSHKLTPQTEKCVICKKPKSLSRSPSVDNSSLQRVNWSPSLLSEKCKKAQDKATKMFVDVVVAQHQGKSSQFSSERERES